MSKELEAFRDILGIMSAVSGCEVDMNSERVRIVKSALQRLESIDKANPSEALECLEEVFNTLTDREKALLNNSWLFNDYHTIKATLLKAQEQEKILKEIIKLIDDLEPTFNRKGVSSDTNILGTIIKDYFYDNASDLLKRWLKND